MEILTFPDASAVAHARARAAAHAEALRFGERPRAHARLVAAEMASNLFKHARDGRLCLQRVERGAEAGLEMVSIDRGPGIRDLAAAMRDGWSSAATLGGGLGAIRRSCDDFDIQSESGKGTVVLTRIWSGGAGTQADTVEIAGISVPFAGKRENGDQWTAVRDGPRLLILLADGLGHGAQAARAANHAVAVMRESIRLDPAGIVARCHAALGGTRGAALAVAEMEPRWRVLRFSGIGNIGARLVCGSEEKRLVSSEGIAGHHASGIADHCCPLPDKALLVMHSDGLSARWDFRNRAALAGKHAGVIAAVLYRDHGKASDDATVVAARLKA